MHTDPVPAFRGSKEAGTIPLETVVNSPTGRFKKVLTNKRGYIRGVLLHTRVCAVVGLSRTGTHFEQELPSGHIVHALRGVRGSGK